MFTMYTCTSKVHTGQKHINVHAGSDPQVRNGDLGSLSSGVKKAIWQHQLGSKTVKWHDSRAEGLLLQRQNTAGCE